MGINNEFKLSELHPCDSCGGPLGMIFHIVDSNIAIINAQEANQVADLFQMFGGALELAEGLAPEDKPVKTASELKNRLLLCPDCYNGSICIPIVIEKQNDSNDVIA